ncbi:MAG: hypothetical protein KZQ65_10185 [Candidatus Thiodiazotropha sp. (ex Gloverina cf. vestifex)]|nr:hypothetical protein [Candidatus Thiodiazotropha sp. (ex Gloverina cf. vestifex)]
MKVFKSTINFFTITLITLMISACGGGGSDSLGGGGGTVPAAGVSITTSNAKPVSAAVVGSTETVQGSALGSGVLMGVSVETPGGAFNYSDFIVHQLNNLMAQNTLLGSSVTGVAITDVR